MHLQSRPKQKKKLPGRKSKVGRTDRRNWKEGKRRNPRNPQQQIGLSEAMIQFIPKICGLDGFCLDIWTSALVIGKTFRPALLLTLGVWPKPELRKLLFADTLVKHGPSIKKSQNSQRLCFYWKAMVWRPLVANFSLLRYVCSSIPARGVYILVYFAATQKWYQVIGDAWGPQPYLACAKPSQAPAG